MRGIPKVKQCFTWMSLTFTGAEDSEYQTSFVIDDTSLNVS
jgi:hypothetical protein